MTAAHYLQTSVPLRVRPIKASQKKFNSRLVAPTFFRNKPFGENVEGLSHRCTKIGDSTIEFND
jgi:hypothetical protein